MGLTYKEEKAIYSKNTIGRYLQAVIRSDDFLDQIDEWLEPLKDDRMQLLRSFIFEVDLSETQELKNTLYRYGGCLTESNYFGRKFFEQMSLLIRQLEMNRQAVAGH